jgi:hypothetical protein
VERGTFWYVFWSRSTDAYYTRCTTSAGATHWYRISDEGEAGITLARTSGARVLPFRGDAMRRVNLILAASPSGRPMLVGTARRGAR